MKNRVKLLFLIPYFWSFSYSSLAQVETGSYVQLIEEEVNGFSAFQTVAYVEKYWRIAGNEGFNASIYHVVEKLEKAGYVEESKQPDARLTYRIEKRKMERPTWEPLGGTVFIDGDNEPLLTFANNRNMMAINSFSTGIGGLKAEVIKINSLEEMSSLNVKGKIVYSEMSAFRLFQEAVVNQGAVGIMVYNNPAYLKPNQNKHSIQFSSIRYNEEVKSWGLILSMDAKLRVDKALSKGKTYIQLALETAQYNSEELTVVASIKGSKYPEKEMVISAHVQEPGANDNASGVGVAIEMAEVTAKLVLSNQLDLKRTFTFLWGDEITSTNRYVTEDNQKVIKTIWGMSLDMVGENTEKTGGSFLIEKMPDPSAIWTRGDDRHTEWGASDIKEKDLFPHYFNDFMINRFKEQGSRAGWKVNFNPFEGGSDHVPFLRAGIPGILAWHFTDQFYHTDFDRIDMVSRTTLSNVAHATLISSYTLLNSDQNTISEIMDEVTVSAVNRLHNEGILSVNAIADNASKASEMQIILAWEKWYLSAIQSVTDIEPLNEANTKLLKQKMKEIQLKTKEIKKSIH